MHWDFALILLFLGIAVPLLGRRRVRQLMQLPSTTKMDRLSLYASTLAFQWIAPAVILWRTAAHGIAHANSASLGNPSLTVTVTVVLAPSFCSIRCQPAPPRRAPRRNPGIASATRAQIISARRRRAPRFFRAGRDGSDLRGTDLSRLRAARFSGLATRLGHRWRRRLRTLFRARAPLSGPPRPGFHVLRWIDLFGIRAWTGSLLPSIAAHFVADITVGISPPLKYALHLLRQQRPVIKCSNSEAGSSNNR